MKLYLYIIASFQRSADKRRSPQRLTSRYLFCAVETENEERDRLVSL